MSLLIKFSVCFKWCLASLAYIAHSAHIATRCSLLAICKRLLFDAIQFYHYNSSLLCANIYYSIAEYTEFTTCMPHTKYEHIHAHKSRHTAHNGSFEENNCVSVGKCHKCNSFRRQAMLNAMHSALSVLHTFHVIFLLVVLLVLVFIHPHSTNRTPNRSRNASDRQKQNPKVKWILMWHIICIKHLLEQERIW